MVDYIRGLKDRYCSACGSWWTDQEAKQKNPLGTRCPRLDCGSKLRFGPRYRRGRAAVICVKKKNRLIGQTIKIIFYIIITGKPPSIPTALKAR